MTIAVAKDVEEFLQEQRRPFEIRPQLEALAPGVGRSTRHTAHPS